MLWLVGGQKKRSQLRRCFLCLTSPLDGSKVKLAVPRWFGRRSRFSLGLQLPDRWRGVCPCCKRPIEARLSEPWRPEKPAIEARGKFAFVICLWGSSPDYIVGAMVLGHSLLKTGSKHARVCLHTDDVPEAALRLLSRLWDCRLVEHVEASMDKLSFQDLKQPHRFDKVFTKLRALGLTEFAKILVMDIDLIVLQNIDELFELQAPAALRRGMNDNKWPLKTGDYIDGRSFYGGKDTGNSKWSWGQGTGINAGVMLLQPDAEVLSDMLEEILEPNHPAHCRGNGPEQDYLSRYWADAPWSYIGVEYNYQLHQMFFALHPKWASTCDRSTLLSTPERIKIVHFSGEPTAKPWHRVLDEKFADFWPDRSRDAEYVQLFAEEFQGHWLWVKKDRTYWEGMSHPSQRTEMKAIFLGEDDELYWRSTDQDAPPELADIPKEATRGAMNLLNLALTSWFDHVQDLERELRLDLKRAALALAGPRERERPSAPAVADPITNTTRSADAFSFRWQRECGWWVEKLQETHERLAVVCGAVPGRSFVSFFEDGKETFGEHEDPELSGVFVKVAGVHCARHFEVPEETETLDYQSVLRHALQPLSLWANAVPVGEAVLIACLHVPLKAVETVFGILAPLGLPTLADGTSGSLSSFKSFAAVGIHRGTTQNSGVSPGAVANGRGTRRSGDSWSSCHASSDVAYAAMPRRTA